jgi:hypothetical protein
MLTCKCGRMIPQFDVPVPSIASAPDIPACPLTQAQCILFKRCSEDLAPFKYAGYPMLLQAISLPDDDASDGAARPLTAHFLGDEIAPRLMVRAAHSVMHGLEVAVGTARCIRFCSHGQCDSHCKS